jgi:hypothetical protein
MAHRNQYHQAAGAAAKKERRRTPAPLPAIALLKAAKRTGSEKCQSNKWQAKGTLDFSR